MDMDYYKKIIENYSRNIKQYSVTVVNSKGSTPASAGQNMLVTSFGQIYGTIGGGNIEQMVITDILSGKITTPTLLSYSFDDRESLEHHHTEMVCGGEASIFINPLFDATELFIFGAGHCSLELVTIMQNLGFFITVLDDRPEWLDKHQLADRTILCNFNDVYRHITDPAQSYILIMTYGHQNDEKVLKQFLKKEYKYLGMMGSDSKVKTLYNNITDLGFSPSDLSHLHAPVGISIGSKTPKEIAISIAAELIKTKNFALEC